MVEDDRLCKRLHKDNPCIKFLHRGQAEIPHVYSSQVQGEPSVYSDWLDATSISSNTQVLDSKHSTEDTEISSIPPQYNSLPVSNTIAPITDNVTTVDGLDDIDGNHDATSDDNAPLL
ncbi:hypothetical protein AAC387_Pa04g1558 [Persea americana]